MRISVNLASRPFADLAPAFKQLRITMAVLAGLSVLFGIGLYLLHAKAEAARQRDHSLDGSLAKLSTERQGYMNTLQAPQNAKLLEQTAMLNRLFDEKSFSWTLAMEDLETVLPGGVQVTALEPARDKQGNITLHLRVLGPRDRSVTLIQNLEHSHRFRLPRIVSESAESNGGPNQRMEPVSDSNRVNFDLLADYVPATQEERRAAEKKAAKPAQQSASQQEPFHAGPGLRRAPYTGGQQ